MSYFPLFLKLDEKRVLLIGGGKIAYEKLSHLLEFTQNITAISKTFNEDFQKKAINFNLKLIEKPYEDGDLKGFDLIVVAIDDINRQKEIYESAKKENLLCNCVDLPLCCDFIFPSYIKKGDLTIAISTNGVSPSFSKHFKNYLLQLIPDSVEDFLKAMREYRKIMPKGEKRMKFLNKKVSEYINELKR